MLHKESFYQFITTPDPDKFLLNDQQKKLLISAIRAIKIDQLIDLATQIKPCIEVIVDSAGDQLATALQLVTLQTLSKDQLISVFKVNSHLNEDDPQLTASSDPSLLSALYKFRHLYFLDKPEKLMENKNAFLDRVSDRLLGRLKQTDSYVSRYLKSFCASLSSEEKEVLRLAYPLESLKMKVFRRNAHGDIALTLLEINVLILSMINTTILTSKPPEAGIAAANMDEAAFKVFDLYTNHTGFKLITENKLVEFKNYLNKDTNNINSTNFHSGMNYFCIAAKLQRPEILTLLIDLKANTNEPDKNGYTPLHYAVEGNCLETFRLVLANTQDPNKLDRGNYSAIYVAAELGKASYVRELLKVNADPNLASNRYKSTPLHIAARNGHKEVIQALLENQKVNVGLQDKDLKVAAQVALNLKDEEINTLFRTHSLLRFAPLPGTAQTLIPPPPAAAVKGSSAPVYTPHQYEQALMDPIKHKAMLQSLRASQPRTRNPFIVYTTLSIQKPSDITSSFMDSMKDHKKAALEAATNFQKIIHYLTTLHNRKLSFVQTYIEITRLIKEIIDGGLSLLAFAFELVVNGFLDHLICLHNKKTILRVAIENEDVQTIRQQLLQTPNCQYTFKYKDKEVTELEYAIHLGSVNSVKALLDFALENKQVNLGTIPDDALHQAEKRNGHLIRLTPAFKALTDVYLINDIFKVFDRNVERVLRNLIRTVPRNQKTVQGMFTLDEYRLFRVLINEKEAKAPEQIEASKHARIRKKLRSVANYILFKTVGRKKIVDNTLHHAVDKEVRIIRPPKEVLDLVTISTSEPKTRAVFKHATCNISEITKTKSLVTVEKALQNGLITFSATPEEDRQNIFFSQNSPAAEITPFLRYKADSVIELHIAEAVNTGLLQQDQIFTSPHLSAFKVQNTEMPILLIGLDPSKKTIYRVFHIRQGNKNYKLHWFDYYHNNKLVGSDYEKNDLQDEFFAGDNIKITAYRFIHILRKSKGLFNEGTYYHYILTNFNNTTLIESAIATFFNVMNTEGKVTTAIPITHPAVKISTNELIKKQVILTKDIQTTLLQHLKENRLNELKETISNYQIHFNQLGFLLIGAIEQQNYSFVLYLLDQGVAINDENYSPFRKAVNELTKIYCSTSRNTSDMAFANAYNIVGLLLHHGSASGLDPQHVRYTSPTDSFSTPKKAGNQWLERTSDDASALKSSILTFDELPIQLLLVESSARHLEELYQFSFDFAQYALHERIAKKLNKPVLSYNEENRNLLAMIDNKNLLELLNFLNQPSLDFNKYFFLIAYAIFSGNIPVTLATHRFFQNTHQDKLLPYLNLTIKLQKIEIFKAIINNLHDYLKRPDGFNLTPYDYAYLYDLPEVLEMITNITPRGTFLFNMIPHHKYRILAYYLNRLDLQITSADFSLTALQAPLLFQAVETKNLTALKIILPRYLEKNADPLVVQSIYRSIIDFAIKHNNVEAFTYVISLLTSTEKDWHDFMQTLFFIQLMIKNMTTEMLEIFLNLSGDHLRKVSPQNHDLLVSAVQSGYSEDVKLKFQLIHRNCPEQTLDLKAIYCQNLLINLAKRSDTQALEFLMQQGVKLNEESTLILLLTNAFFSGKLSFIKWLFDSKLIEPSFKEKRSGKNILQIIFTFSVSGDNQGHDYHSILDYLIEIGVDINHKDNNDKSILFYQSLYNTHQLAPIAGLIRTYAVNSPRTNFTIKNFSEQTALFVQMQPEDYHKTVARYIEQGGDLKHKDCSGLNCLESLLINFPNATEARKRLELEGVPAQETILDNFSETIVEDHQLQLGLITHFCDNKLYLLRKNHEIFFTLPMDDLQSITLVGWSDEVDLPSLEQFCTTGFDELPDPSDIIKDHSADYSWLETPKTFREISTGCYEGATELGTFMYCELAKKLIELIQQNCNLKGHVAENNFKSLSAEKTATFKTSTSNFLKKIYRVINGILKKSPVVLDEETICCMRNFNQTVKVHFLENDRTKYRSDEFEYYSHLAIATRQFEVLKLLLSHQIVDPFTIFAENSSIDRAVQTNQPEMLKLLLAARVTISPEVICQYIERLPKKAEYGNVFLLLLDYIHKAGFGRSIKVRLNSFFTDYRRALDEEVKLITPQSLQIRDVIKAKLASMTFTSGIATKKELKESAHGFRVPPPSKKGRNAQPEDPPVPAAAGAPQTSSGSGSATVSSSGKGFFKRAASLPNDGSASKEPRIKPPSPCSSP